MRAMSLGLIRGTIDEVSQVVHVSYIKARVIRLCNLFRIFSALDDAPRHTHKHAITISSPLYIRARRTIESLCCMPISVRSV